VRHLDSLLPLSTKSTAAVRKIEIIYQKMCLIHRTLLGLIIIWDKLKPNLTKSKTVYSQILSVISLLRRNAVKVRLYSKVLNLMCLSTVKITKVIMVVSLWLRRIAILYDPVLSIQVWSSNSKTRESLCVEASHSHLLTKPQKQIEQVWKCKTR
jgi:hypothetical protein